MFEASSIVHWLGLGVTLVVGLVTGAAIYGAVTTRLKAAEKTIETLAKGHEGRGERLGIVEERVASLEGYLRGIYQKPRD